MSTLTTTIKALRKFFKFQLKRQLHLCSKVQLQVQVHLFTLIQLQYNNNEEKKEEVKNRANYTLN